MKTNEIISKFMGVDKHYEEQSSNIFNQYHLCWNRLMTVVNKCYNHNPIECNELSDITHALLDCNIDEVYNSIIVYIQKHNKELN